MVATSFAAIAILAQAACAASNSETGSNELAKALQPIEAIVREEIQAGRIPGAAVIVGHQGQIVYRQAVADATMGGERITDETIFDLASLTKVVATAPAVMQLVERGKLRLDDRVARHWPAFGRRGKGRITIRQLLTHHSGLRPGLDLTEPWSGHDAALARIVRERPIASPGRKFIYSDINFIVLGELVRRATGVPLDRYCREHLFQPLGMTRTGFGTAAGGPVVPVAYAVTGDVPGQVHDPTAARMGGVAGHAGLFSTARDLAAFAQAMLDGGRAGAVRILQPGTVEEMTASHTPAGGAVRHGLGWDIDSPYAAAWRDVFPGAYGHTGYTGTAMWIDPTSATYVILLTDRVHLARGDARPLRSRVANLVAAALRVAADPVAVRTGIDELAASEFEPLAGLRVGLITNHTGVDASGRRTIDLLHEAPNVSLTAVFSPEHGLNGNADGPVPSSLDPATGIPVRSLYGEHRRPTDEMLDGLDALIFDVQDVGARFYTYVTTMAYAMEAAARKGIPFFVLDRPNPIGAIAVEGPLLDRGRESFTGYFPLPVRHGMTVGELAQLFNGENRIGADLRVIRMRNYRRDAWYDVTGLRWIGPSPNIRSLDQAILYPGVALLEGANVSVGRGTEHPFEVVGAPWIDAQALTSYLERRAIPGVRFEPVHFRPLQEPFRNHSCHGVRITVLDRGLLNSPALGIELASALYRMYGRSFRIEATESLIGARSVVRAITEGRDPRAIAEEWQTALAAFRELRARYLLY